MQNTLTFPPRLPSDSETNPAFNVVIAYEDFETGKQAKKTCDYLAEHIEDDCPVSPQMWKFDVLCVTKLREMAANDAAAADIIIVSAHGANELPSEVKAWIELWVPKCRRAIALVALLDSAIEGWQNPVRDYLADVARRAKLEFFAQPGAWPDRFQFPNPVVTSTATRETSTQTAAMLAQMSEVDGAVPHWGINE